MISDELKSIVDQLNKQGKMSFLDGATEEQIANFEKEHKIKLPLKFKEWLFFTDGGDVFCLLEFNYTVWHISRS